jgi:nitroreductase
MSREPQGGNVRCALKADTDRERMTSQALLSEIDCDFEAFAKVVRMRRSVRAYLPDRIPDEVLDKCLDLALLAPNSQNLEPWQFIEVRDAAKLEKLRCLCLGQPPAAQAPHLIVAVARPDFWRMGRRLMMEALAQDTKVPGIAESYDALAFKYRVLIPLMFEDGPFHVLAPLKRLIVWTIGLFKVFWQFDIGRSGQTLWATKTTALACQNLMLALRAAGYDSCAMEGFDEPRVKRLLGLPAAAHIVMVIAAGKRAAEGVMPLYRFDRNLYVQRV